MTMNPGELYGTVRLMNGKRPSKLIISFGKGEKGS